MWSMLRKYGALLAPVLACTILNAYAATKQTELSLNELQQAMSELKLQFPALHVHSVHAEVLIHLANQVDAVKVDHARFQELQADNVESTMQSEVTKLLSSRLQAHIAKAAVDDDHHEKKHTLTDGYSCESFSSSYDITSFCSNVVDYPFLLGPDQSLVSLEAQARAIAAYFPQTMLPGRCLGDVKKLICGSLYLKCTPSTATIINTNYTITLPYTRPCQSVCYATSYFAGVEDGRCGGRLEILGLATACSTATLSLGYNDYSIYTYADSDECSDMSSVQAVGLVAEANEEYLGQVCAGRVSSFNSAAYAAYVPAIYAPWQPPGVLQAIAEGTVEQIQGTIPRYMTQSCLIAQRSFLCPLLIPQVDANEALVVYSTLLSPVILPALPARSLCTDFRQACPFLTQASPLLDVNCSSTLSLPGVGTIQAYPSEEQILAVIPGLGVPLYSQPYNGSHVVDAQSSAAVVSQSAGLETVFCPYGFQPYDDSQPLPHGVSLPGTGCALQCPSPAYTHSEWTEMFRQMRFMIIFCLTLVCLQVLNLMVLKVARQNMFLIASVSTTLLAFVLQGMQLLDSSVNMSTDESVCSSNVTWRSVYDWDSMFTSFAGISCFLYGYLSLLLTLFSQWVLFAVSIEIWLRVACNYRQANIDHARKVYVHGGLFTVVLYFTLLVVLNREEGDVNKAGASWMLCAWTPGDREVQLYAMTIPFMINIFISVCCMSHALIVCFKTAMKVWHLDAAEDGHGGQEEMKSPTFKALLAIKNSAFLALKSPTRASQPAAAAAAAGSAADATSNKAKGKTGNKAARFLSRLWKSYGMLFLFLLLQLLFFPINVGYYSFYIGYWQTPALIDGIVDWAACAFTATASIPIASFYTSSGDQGAALMTSLVINQCGETVDDHRRLSPVQFVVPLLVQAFLSAICLFAITFVNKEVRAFYHRLYIRVLGSLQANKAAGGGGNSANNKLTISIVTTARRTSSLYSTSDQENETVTMHGSSSSNKAKLGHQGNSSSSSCSSSSPTSSSDHAATASSSDKNNADSSPIKSKIKPKERVRKASHGPVDSHHLHWQRLKGLLPSIPIIPAAKLHKKGRKGSSAVYSAKVIPVVPAVSSSDNERDERDLEEGKHDDYDDQVNEEKDGDGNNCSHYQDREKARKGEILTATPPQEEDEEEEDENDGDDEADEGEGEIVDMHGLQVALSQEEEEDAHDNSVPIMLV